MASVGPIPFCAMVLAGWGAEVLRIERPEKVELGAARDPRYEFTQQGRAVLRLDLKSAADAGTLLDRMAQADILIEGFRPGVMERLGLGPAEAHGRNPRLVYGRMTGWGQEGPLAHAAGHDINYIALAGALHCCARDDAAPVPPLNLLGDYAGGALFLLAGVLAALRDVACTGRGTVIDAAMVDGVNLLLTHLHGLEQGGYWKEPDDARTPWYDVYRTRDGRYVSVGAVEERFYRVLLERLGLDFEAQPDRRDRANWPVLRRSLEEIFATRTQAEWCALLEGSDACFAPVLTPAEARLHPHAQARGCFLTDNGLQRPAPAPRFHTVRDVRNGP